MGRQAYEEEAKFRGFLDKGNMVLQICVGKLVDKISGKSCACIVETLQSRNHPLVVAGVNLDISMLGVESTNE